MLILNRADLHAMRAHAELSYPEECCGVLLGQSIAGRRAVSCSVRCKNASAEQLPRRYAIDPRELIGIQGEARTRQLDIVGFYHSHPDHPAQWSQTDLDEAHWLGCSYVIIQVEAGRATETNSFSLAGCSEDGKYFASEEIAIQETSSSAAISANPQ